MTEKAAEKKPSKTETGLPVSTSEVLSKETEEKHLKQEAGKPESEDSSKAAEKPRARNKADDNVVFVGKKPTMSYVLAVVTQFSDGSKDVHVKARGKSISTAVDVAEAVKNKFMHDLKNTVAIGTEVVDAEGRKLNVSTIDIVLTK